MDTEDVLIIGALTALTALGIATANRISNNRRKQSTGNTTINETEVSEETDNKDNNGNQTGVKKKAGIIMFVTDGDVVFNYTG